MSTKWDGPYQIDELLDNCFDETRKAPEDKSCYVVSKVKWEKEPDISSQVIYVGGTTGNSPRFRTRVGDLIADAFGFFGEKAGHHSGGRKIHDHCKGIPLNPKNLYIGWLVGVPCGRCAETALYNYFNKEGKLLNKNRPPACTGHDKPSLKGVLLKYGNI